MLKLNLPEFGHKIKQKEGKLYIYDIVRKKYVVLQPEEWVRQHLIHYLINAKNISPNHIKLEHGISYSELQKRSDIIVWNRELKPILLIECKAPHIEIDAKTIFQLGIYNSDMNVQYLGLSNGIKHYYYQRIEDEYVIIEELPEF